MYLVAVSLDVGQLQELIKFIYLLVPDDNNTEPFVICNEYVGRQKKNSFIIPLYVLPLLLRTGLYFLRI